MLAIDRNQTRDNCSDAPGIVGSSSLLQLSRERAFSIGGPRKGKKSLCVCS